MQTSSDVLFASLKEFFADPGHLKKLTRVLNPSPTETHKVSLRIIDWCVVNYAKAHNTAYIVHDGPGDERVFNVFLDYKSQLKGFSKTRFDCFKRGPRVCVTDATGAELETTVGQLNFFRWAIRYKVIEYCEAHVVDIEKDMLRVTREKDGTGKRKHLSKLGATTHPMTLLRVKIKFT